jgi:twitching motility protein PilU
LKIRLAEGGSNDAELAGNDPYGMGF